MALAVSAVRVILGLFLLVFGLNGFLGFIPQPAPPAEGGAFLGALSSGLYIQIAHAVEAVAGLLLLVNRAVPLALTMLVPVVVGIVVYHLVFAPAGGVPGYVVAALVAFLVWAYRASFLPLLEPGRPLAAR